MFVRKSTWEADLNAYLAETRTAPHVWGELDCALRAGGAVHAMTGIDPGLRFRGQYSTKLGAAKALKKFGAGDLESTFDATFPPISVGFVKRGDLVWDGECVGICIGAEAVFFVEDMGGEVRVPRRGWLKGWRVG